MADYVISGLVKRRAELAGEADTLRTRMAQIGADIGHLDATIRLFDPDYNLAGIRPKRVRAGDGAGRGELSRVVLGVLREASKPMTTAAVVAAVMAGRRDGRAGPQGRGPDDEPGRDGAAATGAERGGQGRTRSGAGRGVDVGSIEAGAA